MTVDTSPVEGETAPPAEGSTPPADGATPPAQEPTAYEKALEAERAERKKLEAELKKRQAADEKARIAALDENARAVEEAKAAAKAEVAAEYEAKIMGLRVQARAAGFHDPALVASLLELSTDATDADIDKALEALAKEKPYLVKQGGSGVPPMAQGPRGGAAPAAGASGDDWLRQMVIAKQQG